MSQFLGEIGLSPLDLTGGVLDLVGTFFKDKSAEKIAKDQLRAQRIAIKGQNQQDDYQARLNARNSQLIGAAVIFGGVVVLGAFMLRKSKA